MDSELVHCSCNCYTQAMPRLLDLFARAQGTSVGYARAGYEVTASDIATYPKHPEVHAWVTADAFDILKDVEYCQQFDIIALSPNCEGYSSLQYLPTSTPVPQQIHLVRPLLQRIGKPYVIENVALARWAMINPIRMCGSAFNLGSMCRDGNYRQLRRHRLFESNIPLNYPFGCTHAPLTGGVYGTGGGGPQTRGYRFWPEEARTAMGIDWMGREDICKAIPPVYTETIGRYLLNRI